MIPRIAKPRLLPLTILGLAAVLTSKSIWLARSWPSAVVGPAHAAEHPPKAPDTPPKPPPAAAPAAPTPEAAAPPPISDSERSVLLELRQRRQELERRDADVLARESVLTATEQKLDARVLELKTLQSQLAALDTARQQRDDASLQSLVKVYETMKPRDAAAIFNDLTMTVLLPLVAHMKEAKTAAILAAMSPDKARDLTAQLAKFRAAPDPPVAPPPPPKS